MNFKSLIPKTHFISFWWASKMHSTILWQSSSKQWGALIIGQLCHLDQSSYLLVQNPFQNTYNPNLRSNSHKKTEKLTVRGEGGGGVNPYGQPDRKKSGLYDFLIVPNKYFCVLTITFPRWLQLFLATSLLLIDFGLVAIVAILEKQRNLENPQGKLQNLKHRGS